MRETYSFRRYEPGDEDAINGLYYIVTGRRRTRAQFRWQWLDAPGGNGEVWLIEATDEKGDTKLIGHHGVMPIRFTNSGENLLFGKTENTMVLPEYRQKILYPRFEQRFLQNYSSRFDALFSTMGPKAAVRQRQAHGYTYPAGWQSGKYRTGISSDLYFLCSVCRNKIANSGPIETPYGSRLKEYSRLVDAGFVSDEEASRLSFFGGYWSNARENSGIAPRRDHADLAWRFWRNPYKSHLTLVVNNASLTGYAIVSFQPGYSGSVFLEDLSSLGNARDDHVRIFLYLLKRLKSIGISWISVVQSTDSALFSKTELLVNNELFLWKLGRRAINRDVPLMPRKITEMGAKKGLLDENWDATAFLFEGRL